MIGGLTVATLLTLVVIPVVYSLVDRKADAANTAEEPVSRDAETAVPEPVAIEPVGEAS